MAKVATPKVTVVSYSHVSPLDLHEAAGWAWEPDMYRAEDADSLVEFAGRNCYQAWNRANPATAANGAYVANIIKQQHFSVLEHGSVTFHISGVSRSLLTELERHRHLSFSVLSQRYVDESESPMVLPPALAELNDPYLQEIAAEADLTARRLYLQTYTWLVEEHGFNRKDARSAARAWLPNAWSTQIVVTGNHRTWREIVAKRSDPGADREIRDLMALILVVLKELAPATYADMELVV